MTLSIGIIFAITLMYSPSTFMYATVWSILNFKIIFMLILVGLATLVHLIVWAIVTLAKQTIDNSDTKESKNGGVKESLMMAVYDEIVYRSIILNILLNSCDPYIAALITSLFSDGLRIAFMIRVYLFGNPNESSQAKLRLVMLAFNFVFSVFVSHMVSKTSGFLILPMIVRLYLMLIIYPRVESLVKKRLNPSEKVAYSSYIVLIILLLILLDFIY